MVSLQTEMMVCIIGKYSVTGPLGCKIQKEDSRNTDYITLGHAWHMTKVHLEYFYASLVKGFQTISKGINALEYDMYYFELAHNRGLLWECCMHSIIHDLNWRCINNGKDCRSI